MFSKVAGVTHNQSCQRRVTKSVLEEGMAAIRATIIHEDELPWLRKIKSLKARNEPLNDSFALVNWNN
jgi:hypothetical protein